MLPEIWLSEYVGLPRKRIPAMPLLEHLTTGASPPSVPAVRKRLLEADPKGVSPGTPAHQRPAARLSRSASGLLEQADNPPVAPHKKLCTEIPAAP